MEIEGTTFSNLSNKKADSASDVADEDETQAAIEQAEKDADDIAKSLVSRKKRGLIEAMQVHLLVLWHYRNYSLIAVLYCSACLQFSLFERDLICSLCQTLFKILMPGSVGLNEKAFIPIQWIISISQWIEVDG